MTHDLLQRLQQLPPRLAVFLITMLPVFEPRGPAERHLRRFRVYDRLSEWIFRRAVARSALVRRYQAIGLMPLVAIPAPITGAGTGAVLAYLFKLPLRLAFPCIILGICLAGVVVALVSLGAVGLWSLF